MSLTESLNGVGTEFGLNTGLRIRQETHLPKTEWNYWTSKGGIVHMTGQLNKEGVPDYTYVSTSAAQSPFPQSLHTADIYVQVQGRNETTILRAVGKDDSEEELTRAQQSLNTILTTAGFSEEKRPTK